MPSLNLPGEDGGAEEDEGAITEAAAAEISAEAAAKDGEEEIKAKSMFKKHSAA